MPSAGYLAMVQYKILPLGSKSKMLFEKYVSLLK